jgi:hypothetical protein
MHLDLLPRIDNRPTDPINAIIISTAENQHSIK